MVVTMICSYSLPVCQWSDDETPRVTQILITIEKFCIHRPDVQVISRPVISAKIIQTHTHTQ